MFHKILRFIASMQLALITLSLIMGLLVIGTVYQGTFGAVAAQDNIFHTLLIYWQRWNIPVYPGGYLLGGIFVVNMTASLTWRLKFTRKNAGVVLVHIGLITLVFGQLLSSLFSTESLLPLKVGENVDHSLEIHKAELVVTDASSEIAVFPEKSLTEGSALQSEHWPFTLHVTKVLPNATLSPEGTTPLSHLATEGVGAGAAIAEAPPTNKDGEVNFLTAWVNVVGASEKTQGTWLVSTLIEEDQPLTIEDHQYALTLRPKWRHLPFSIELIEFRSEMHPGTQIPKSFSSVVQLYTKEGKADRRALISMNKPLKYQGRTFYQASADKRDGLSVFQVVENPTWATPYFASGLVLLGLTYQFVCGLLFSIKRRQ